MISQFASNGETRTILVSHEIPKLNRGLKLTRVAAIWDNRSFFHSATFDYDGLGERNGNRAVGIGETPYLDPNSKSRSEVLAHA
jgi:hypothetical protein